MKVIGTAGHIDHGKSTLVERLTGIDPDRLSEEKRRGMTIDLGFAWLTLPSGTDVSVIDVPGHERFVKNMLAGAAGIDVALLVVAADEGVMPQTREHLSILELLGLTHGLVALTKVDLVDDEWRELVREDVVDALRETGLQRAPIVPVSAVTGEGVSDLLLALDTAVASTPDPVDRGLPYLPVDRVFSVSGFGTVVTGTLHNGQLRIGDDVEIVPRGGRARIRGLQTHRRQVDVAGPGSRVAVNLAGAAREDLSRGDLLAHPGTVPSVRRADASLRVLPDAPFSLAHGTEVTVHIGAAERQATVTVLTADAIEPGEQGWVQIRFVEPVAALRGQRYIVRLPSPVGTIGGGEIIDVGPKHRRMDSGAVEKLGTLSSSSLTDAVSALLPADKPRLALSLAAHAGATVEQTEGALRELVRRGDAVQLGAGFLSATGWTSLLATSRAEVSRYHQEFPLRRGMSKEELRSKLHWPESLWPATCGALLRAGVLREDGGLVALPDHIGGTGNRRAEAERVLAALGREPFAPPSGNELLAAAKTDSALLAAMVEEGEIVHVGNNLYFTRAAYDTMVRRTAELLQTQREVSVASVRDALGTSRKYALHFLEYLDSQRLTQRRGDVRVAGSRLAS